MLYNTSDPKILGLILYKEKENHLLVIDLVLKYFIEKRKVNQRII